MSEFKIKTSFLNSIVITKAISGCLDSAGIPQRIWSLAEIIIDSTQSEVPSKVVTRFAMGITYPLAGNFRHFNLSCWTNNTILIISATGKILEYQALTVKVRPFQASPVTLSLFRTASHASLTGARIDTHIISPKWIRPAKVRNKPQSLPSGTAKASVDG